MENTYKNNELTFKDKMSGMLAKTKKYCVEHKDEILLTSIAGISITTCLFLGYKNHSLNKTDMQKCNQIKDLKKVNSFLNEELFKKDCRIFELEDLCQVKDEFFDKAISSGTRSGDSFCAQQLAYKRWLNIN